MAKESGELTANTRYALTTVTSAVPKSPTWRVKEAGRPCFCGAFRTRRPVLLLDLQPACLRRWRCGGSAAPSEKRRSAPSGHSSWSCCAESGVWDMGRSPQVSTASEGASLLRLCRHRPLPLLSLSELHG